MTSRLLKIDLFVDDVLEAAELLTNAFGFE